MCDTNPSAKLNAALIHVINHTCAFPVKMKKDPLTGSVIAERPEVAVKKKKKKKIFPLHVSVCGYVWPGVAK